ncbi:MAG: hypothetical protein KDN22_33330, partial [Verrucomicrobiae bacterium]|nr:hypothetical protein [Verrucomicrobiae bacterium]
ALRGAPLRLGPEFVPMEYRSVASDPEWFLNGQSVGRSPLLTALQVAGIADGTSQLTFTAGGVKISPKIPVYDSPAMAEYLRAQGVNEEQLAPYLDIDGDGFSALEEFGFGTKAGDGSSRPYIIGVLVGIPGTPEQKFELVYPRRT